MKGWTFPARGTWIEMRKSGKEAATTWDVPRKGNVDRNIKSECPGAELF